jgi:hypothetical protein
MRAHVQVNAYVEVTAHSNANDVGSLRAVFAALTQEDVSDYYRLSAVMEALLGFDSNPMQVSSTRVVPERIFAICIRRIYTRI